MNANEMFNDKVCQRIWEQFFSRIRRISRSLNDEVRRDLLLELQGHLLESFRTEEGQSESERLLDAIDKMGAPEDFLKPMLADRFIMSAQRSFNLKSVVKGLYYNAYRGTSMVVVSLLVGLGYLLSISLVVSAVLKPIFPNNTGLLFLEDEDIVVGFRLGTDPIVSDPLGYWTIPIALALAALLYIGLTKFTRVLRQNKTL
jgi:hypothetical protein